MPQQYSQQNVFSETEKLRTRSADMIGEQRLNFSKSLDVAMRDCVADWYKWSPTERVLAVVVTLLIVSVPLGILLTANFGS